MTLRRVSRWGALTLSMLLVATTVRGQGTATQAPYEPKVGQAGKDVVWVPTPQALVDKMLDMAKVTPQDYLIDLGSGDGRTVITAAKRGARALGHRIQPGHGGARRSATPPRPGVARQGDVREGRHLRERLFQGDGHHDVPAAAAQPEAAAEAPRSEARHAHRLQLFTMDDWEPDETATGHRRLHELVHGALLGRSGEGGGHLAARRTATSC